MKTQGSSLIILILFLACNSKETIKLTNPDTDMKELIEIIAKDSLQHENIEPTLSDVEIKKEENEIGIKLPNSYKLFLKNFGNGAKSLYHIDQPVNGVNNKQGRIHWFGKYRNNLGEEIQTDNFGVYKTNSLLCLMTENSNGGAWVWLTSENLKSGEWPLAYYNINDQKLYYKIENFKEWIRLATKFKYEIIRELDKENKLKLG